MPGRTINVVQPHALTQEAAWDRLLTIRQSIEGGSWLKADVELVEIHGYPKQFKLDVKIRVSALGRSVTHTLTFQVDSHDVQVTSEPADEMFESLEMAIEETQIKAMLAEAMK